MDGWKVTEDDSFAISVIGCGGFEAVDDALQILEYALHRNPLGFPAVPGYPNIRIAKTAIRILNGSITPALRLRIWTDQQTRTVYKLHVEISHPDDMKLWDEDDSPF